jgi:hypothetical protein
MEGVILSEGLILSRLEMYTTCTNMLANYADARNGRDLGQSSAHTPSPWNFHSYPA